MSGSVLACCPRTVYVTPLATAKQDQKEHGIILMRSRLPEKVTAADHDTTELQLY